MQPHSPLGTAQRAIDRLDAICKEISAPLAGALPALVLVAVLLFTNPAIPQGAAVAAAACDHSRAAPQGAPHGAPQGTPQAAGPHSQDLLCMGRSLQEAADANAAAKATANGTARAGAERGR